MLKRSRVAVVLFNLGGPDSLDSVKPFLFNLFYDPAIISIPKPFRWILAQIISRRRTPIAQEIYSRIGGKSPLLELTQEQADLLKIHLSDFFEDVETFVCMRYWHPRGNKVIQQVKTYNPDKIILLPLYPQHSTTTVASSMQEWRTLAKQSQMTAQTHVICCYPRNGGLIDAQADLIKNLLRKTGPNLRILFSAHGLPKKVVGVGDPYQWQVERTAEAVIKALGGYDSWRVCYQSRVGPLEWIGPSTEEELKAAATDGVGVIVVPIAFVSEHSETLVELDIEYKELADELGVKCYHRLPAIGSHPNFIEGMGNLVREACKASKETPYGGNDGFRICPRNFVKCPIIED